jgi:hypothetical protein
MLRQEEMSDGVMDKRKECDRNTEDTNKGKGKGKAIPLQALTGPDGSRRLRLPDFKTFGA